MLFYGLLAIDFTQILIRSSTFKNTNFLFIWNNNFNHFLIYLRNY